MRIVCFSLTLSVLALAAPPSPKLAARVKSAPSATAESHTQKPLSEVLTGPARVAYESGRLLLEADDSATAHAKFKEAYELSKSPRLLWNMAACSKLQRRYAMAVQELELFLSDGAGHITPEQEARARELLETLRVVVAPVTVRVTPSHATLAVDGELRATVNGEYKFLADVGRHEFRGTLEAHTTASRAIDINETKALAVDLQLVPIVPDSTLTVATLAEAAVEVDGRAFSVGSREASIAPGTHNVRVWARDYKPWASEVQVGTGEHKAIAAMLEPEAKTNWWLVGTAAAVTFVGLGVGAYYLFKPEPVAAPPPIYLQPIAGSVATLPLP